MAKKSKRKEVKKKKRGAIELSMSTIVILVLVMVFLILGIVLLRNIFTGANEAIGNIDQGVQKAIMDAFADPNKQLVLYPSEREVEIKQKTTDKGFAFSVRNTAVSEQDYTYNVYVDPNYDIKTKCEVTAQEANSWVLNPTGSISLARGQIMEYPELIKYNIPADAPPCSVFYKLDVKKKDGTMYASSKVQIIIVSR